MKGMKKITLSLVLIIALLLVPGVIFATGEALDDVAVVEIDGKEIFYSSLAQAVSEAPKDNTQVTIKLLKTVEDGSGIVTVAGQNVVIDFGGFSYDASNPTVGSDGTETLSCQLNKGSTVVFKNGTFITTKAKMLIQNYANLTVEDMVLDATESKNDSNDKCYGISNNCGTVKIIGETDIISKGWPAIDVCWAPNKGYAEGTQVTVNTTGKVAGDIELSIWGDVDEAQKRNVKSNLVIENINHDGNINIAEDYLKEQIKIQGGIFSTDVNDYVVDNYYAKKQSNGTYLVKQIVNILKANITGILDKIYDGKVITQSITLKYNGVNLEKGIDYIISYSNNTKPGKAKIVITGKGAYKGTVEKTFLITPKKLTGLEVSDKTTSKITLSWTKHDGVTGYKIYSYNSSKKKWEYVGKTNDTSYTIEKLKSSTKYEYRVRAYKNIDGTQYFGAYASSVKTATKPKTPSVKVKAGDKKVTFTWDKVAGATGYKIYMATSKNGKYTRIKTITNNKTFKYTKSGLKANTKYYFKVRAYKQVDDEQIYSSYTKVLNATTKKVHVVKKGNTLYSIAKKYKTTVAKLVKINNLKKASAIRIGLRLLLN